MKKTEKQGENVVGIEDEKSSHEGAKSRHRALFDRHSGNRSGNEDEGGRADGCSEPGEKVEYGARFFVEERVGMCNDHKYHRRSPEEVERTVSGFWSIGFLWPCVHLLRLQN